MTRRRWLVLLLLAALVVALAGNAVWRRVRREAAPAGAMGPRPIVLITIDTWRADRLTPALTPRLLALAGRGALFLTARSPVPLTLPAHVSLMTGLLPSAHGVHQNGRVLSPQVPRLATWLGAAGYDTAAFVGAFVLDRRFGLADGFSLFDDHIVRDRRRPDRLEAERPASDVADRAIAWLAERPAGEGGAPYFLWVHFYDPHAPYRPPSGVPAGDNPYDAEIRYTDGQAGRLLDALARRGDLERALLVVAGDHGESLGEHGERTHGMLLYEAALRVPVIIHGHGVEPVVREDPIGLIDLAPTILAQSGAPVPPGLDGIDVLAQTGPTDREIYSETEYPQVAGWSPLASIVSGRWKVIASSETELYDLQADSRELTNLFAARQSTAASMIGRIAALRDRRARAQAPEVSPEIEERLRALGYVAPTAPAPVGSRDGANPAEVIDGWVAFENVLDHLTAGRAADAIPTAGELAERFPRGHIFQMTYARALQDAGRSSEALAAYKAAARRFDSSASLLHDLAVAARAAGDPAEAVRAERAALALDPLYAAAHNGLGLALTDLRQWTPAAAAFTEAARLDPRHPPFLVNLANARRELSDFAAAESAYQQALGMEPSNADAANGLGTIFVVTGRAAQAISWFERALTSDPQFVGARLNLGIACQEAGRPADAEAAYRAVLEVPGDFDSERRTARALLDKLARARR